MFYEGLAGIKKHKDVEGLIKHIETSGLDRQALAMLQKHQPSTSKEELANVKKPVLVICGNEDEDNGSSKKLAELIPKSSYVTVPGVHNKANQNHEFSAAVISFFTRAYLQKASR